MKILPISDRLHDYARSVCDTLNAAGFRVELDDRSEKIGYKIREAQLEKVPYMLIVGDKEVESGTVGVRARKEGDIGAMSLEDFMARLREQVETKAID